MKIYIGKTHETFESALSSACFKWYYCKSIECVCNDVYNVYFRSTECKSTVTIQIFYAKIKDRDDLTFQFVLNTKQGTFYIYETKI